MRKTLDLDMDKVVLTIISVLVLLGQLVVIWMILMTPRASKQEVYAAVRSGEVTPGVPCWAVYNYNDVLVARTALANDMGVLREFNVLGGPINPEPLPEPWRWFELSAEFSKEEP